MTTMPTTKQVKVIARIPRTLAQVHDRVPPEYREGVMTRHGMIDCDVRGDNWSCYGLPLSDVKEV